MKARQFLFLLPALFHCLVVAQGAIAQSMRAHFIDVGQGSATLLEFSCAAVLIDTGGEANSQFDSSEQLTEYLDAFFARRSDLKRTLSSVILTHPHVDHTRGVKTVLSKYTVLNALTNGQENGSGRFGQIALHQKVAISEGSSKEIGFEAIWVKDIPKRRGLSSPVIDPVQCSDVDPEITALWGQVDKSAKWKSSDMKNGNNHSIVLRVQFGSASLLVTGDLEEAGIAGLLAHYHGSAMLDVDVYLVGHHGAANATTEPFLRAITPKMAVISMGPFDREEAWSAWQYGHPRKVAIDKLQQHVQEKRATVHVPIASAAKTFQVLPITKAIYSTGWDGNFVLETDVSGAWRFVGAGSTPSNKPELVNLNTSTENQLMALPMIGENRARAIVQHREKHGPFQTVNDLTNVPGIGRGTVSAIRNLATTGN